MHGLSVGVFFRAAALFFFLTAALSGGCAQLYCRTRQPFTDNAAERVLASPRTLTNLRERFSDGVIERLLSDGYRLVEVQTTEREDVKWKSTSDCIEAGDGVIAAHAVVGLTNALDVFLLPANLAAVSAAPMKEVTVRVLVDNRGEIVAYAYGQSNTWRVDVDKDSPRHLAAAEIIRKHVSLARVENPLPRHPSR